MLDPCLSENDGHEEILRPEGKVPLIPPEVLGGDFRGLKFIFERSAVSIRNGSLKPGGEETQSALNRRFFSPTKPNIREIILRSRLRQLPILGNLSFVSATFGFESFGIEGLGSYPNKTQAFSFSCETEEYICSLDIKLFRDEGGKLSKITFGTPKVSLLRLSSQPSSPATRRVRVDGSKRS